MRMKLTAAAVLVVLIASLAVATTVTEDSDGYFSEDLPHGSIKDDNNVKYYVICDADRRKYTDDDLLREDIIINSKTVMDGAFEGCTTLDTVFFTTKTTTVGDEAFKGCTNLTHVEAPKVKTFGDHVFQDSGITRLWAESECTSFGVGAFMGCERLADILTAQMNVTSFKKDTFRDSGIRFIDMTKIRSFDPSAFEGSKLTYQLVPSMDSVHVPGVSRIVCQGTYQERGFSEVDVNSLSQFTLQMVNGHGDELPRVVSSDGEVVDVMWTNESHGYVKFTLDPAKDYYIGQDVYVLEPEGEEPIVVGDDSTVSLPVLPDKGDLRFLGWTFGGSDVPVTEISASDLEGMGTEVGMTPAYSTATVTFDHSSIAGLTDISGLETKMEFTVGDTYPQPGGVAGYTFLGWTVGDSTVLPGDEITTYRDHTAVGIWESAETYTLTYLDGQGEVLKEIHFDYGETATVTGVAADPPENHRFAGWMLSGEPVEDGHTIIMTSDVILTPRFEELPLFTVRFVVDGTETFSEKVHQGTAYAILLDDPEAEWREFQHWSDGGSGKLYRGDVIIVDGDMTLTAVWKDISRATVTYHFTGGTDSSVVAVGSEFTVGKVLDDTDGRRFLGWSTAYGDTEAEYTAGEGFIVSRDTDLYPVWYELRFYHVHYTGEGMEAFSDTFREDEDARVTIHEPSRAGYDFAGWDLDGATLHKGDALDLDGDVTLTAVWEPVPTFTVTFTDGTERADYGVRDGDQFTVPDVGFQRDGFRLSGWSYSEGGDAEVCEGDILTPDRDLMLHAVWEPLGTFTVTFMDGGEEIASRTVTAGGSVGTDVGSRDIVGWSLTDGGPVAYGIGVSITPSGDMTLHAVHREPGTVLLKYMDGGVLVHSVVLRQGENAVLDGDVHSREGYRLAGWSVSAGGDVSYRDGDTVRVDEDTCVHAVWERVYVVTFMDGNELVSEETVTAGGSVDVPGADEPDLLGWSVSADSDVAYRPGDGITPKSDMTLYAVWEGRFTLTLLNGNHVEWTASVTAGTEARIPDLGLTLQGYAFMGWTDGESGYSSGDSVRVDSDTTLRAVWERVDTGNLPPVIVDDGGAVIIPVRPAEGDDDGITTGEIAAMAAGILGALVAIMIAVQIRRN